MTFSDPCINTQYRNKCEPPAGSSKKILVAEDNDFNYFLIEAMLKPLNLKIYHAKNGQEAVNIFQSESKISLVLMDIQMPVMDGFTATREIKKSDKNIPVIIQTAYAYDHYKQQATETGCCDFIEKPLDPDVLIRKVKKFID